MADAILSRTQRNDIFQLITRVELDPTDFQWDTQPAIGVEHPKETLYLRY